MPHGCVACTIYTLVVTQSSRMMKSSVKRIGTCRGIDEPQSGEHGEHVYWGVVRKRETEQGAAGCRFLERLFEVFSQPPPRLKPPLSLGDAEGAGSARRRNSARAVFKP